MIRLADIEKVYRTEKIETVALANVNLEVAPGEFVSIMGPSGCGKSTLLHVMGLLDAPTRGTVALDGTVGRVGGGAQKAITVRDAGYEVFLVPSDEVDEMREAVGDDLEVIAVDSLAEALQALDSLGGNAGALLAANTAASPA